jgi:hypothetical protein
MNYFLILYSLLLLCPLYAIEDIVIKSRIDEQSSDAVIDQMRSFFINNNFGDPYRQTFKEPIRVDLNEVIDELPADTQKWLLELQNVLRIKFFESKYSLVINDFSYVLEDFNSHAIPLGQASGRIEYVTNNFARGIILRASQIAFEVELARTSSGDPIRFSFNLIKPQFEVGSNIDLQIPMKWRSELFPKVIFLSLYQVDLTKVISRVVNSPESISLSVDDFSMPEVSIRIGAKEVKFDRGKIKNYFIQNKERMKVGILEILKVRMDERFSNILENRPLAAEIPRFTKIKSPINASFEILSMESANNQSLQLNVSGLFCEEACPGKILNFKDRRVLTENDFKLSMIEVDEQLSTGKANLAVSISESYINNLISTTIKAGLWDEIFKGKTFKLGPEKAFILALNKGKDFDLYLDIIQKLAGSQRILTGMNELRFPVRLKISLNILKEHEIPRLRIKVSKLATDDRILLNGLPEFGLVSNVSEARFRSKVLKSIMEDLSSFEKVDLIDIELNEFKETFLEQLEFYSNGRGRGTAVIDLNPFGIAN